MKPREMTRLLVLSGMVTLATDQGSVAATANEAAVAAAGERPEKIALQANSEFAFDLYAQLAKEHAGKNLFFSPHSLSNALLMTAEGARAKTADEMGEVLGFPDSLRRTGDDAQQIPWEMGKIHVGQAQLNRLFKNKQIDPLELRVANAVWGEKTNAFAAPWVRTIRSAYDTGAVQEADFLGNPERERARINAWVEEQTKQRIKNLLPIGSIKRTTRLVLTNAVYFKADWESPFSKKSTRDDEFMLGSGAVVKVPIMSKRGMKNARYAAFNADGSFFATPENLPGQVPKPPTYPDKSGFAMVELPYRDGKISMIVIAPNRPDGLPALEANLKSASVEKWITDLKHRPVHLNLPKFKSETTYNLNQTLGAMGMNRAFTDPALPGGADFSGMMESPNPNNRVYIQLVAHKAFIEIDEEGTEAAAATGVAMDEGDATSTEIIPFTPVFRADRPFLYLIRDKKSGAILFLGRVSDPRA